MKWWLRLRCLRAFRRIAWLLSITVGVSLIAGSNPCQARLVHILHTNDLHAHFEHSNSPTKGGYAAVKATLDRLTDEAARLGRLVVRLDAGDFTEGSKFYLLDRGLEAYNIMNLMGYDAIALGNHDWLMGPDQLDLVMGLARPRSPLLAANFYHSATAMNLTQFIKPYRILEKENLRIAVIGLTTPDPMYAWRVPNTRVVDPSITLQQAIPVIRPQADAVIALTHLGITLDERLVRSSEGLDLVVGGHSHTVLTEPYLVPDPTGRQIPIVQTGRFGESVGDLLVDITPGQPMRVISYRLVPVLNTGLRDPAVEGRVELARARFEEQMGREWLNTVVGRSEVPLLRPARGKETEWSHLIADSFRRVADAQISIDFERFHAFEQPAGEIRREQLFEYYPRIFETDRPTGWTVWKGRALGSSIKIGLRTAFSDGVGFSVSGLKITTRLNPQTHYWEIDQILLADGSPLNELSWYTIALPEGIVRGGFGITSLVSIFFRDVVDTRVPIITAVETELKIVTGRDGALKAAAPDAVQYHMNPDWSILAPSVRSAWYAGSPEGYPEYPDGCGHESHELPNAQGLAEEQHTPNRPESGS